MNGAATWRSAPLAALLALVLTLLVAAPVVAADEAVLDTIALRHRDAEELIPLLRPVAAGLVLTGQAGTLIVRGPRARIEELRAVLATLDVPVRTLLVSLRQGSLDEIDAAGAGASGGVETGPDGAHVVGRVTVEHYGTRGRDDTVQTVRVLDGREAYIAIGRTVPVPQRYGAAVGPRGGVAAEVGLDYRDASTGYLVRPRVAGDRVTVEIAPRSVRAGADGGFDTASLNTTLSGRLGTWLLIGGSVEARRADRDAVVHSTRARSGAERVYLLKVEVAP